MPQPPAFSYPVRDSFRGSATSFLRYVPGILYIRHAIAIHSFIPCQRFVLGIFHILPEIRSGDPPHPARDTFRGSFISGMPQPSALSYPVRDSFRGSFTSCQRFVPGIRHILPEIRSRDPSRPARVIPGILHIRHATAIRFFTSCQRSVKSCQRSVPGSITSYQRFVLGILHIRHATALRSFISCRRFVPGIILSEIRSGNPSHPARDSFRGLACLRYVPRIRHILPEIRSGILHIGHATAFPYCISCQRFVPGILHIRHATAVGTLGIHHILVPVVFLFTYCFIAICYVYRCLTTVSTLQRTSIFMLSHELVVRLFSYIYLYISLC